jgi:hypothetical protein
MNPDGMERGFRRFLQGQSQIGVREKPLAESEYGDGRLIGLFGLRQPLARLYFVVGDAELQRSAIAGDVFQETGDLVAL